MTDKCESYSNGFCLCFNEDLNSEDYPDFEDNPTGCDDLGLCDDEYNFECDMYAEEDVTCGNCGERYENCECEE